MLTPDTQHSRLFQGTRGVTEAEEEAGSRRGRRGKVWAWEVWAKEGEGREDGYIVRLRQSAEKNGTV